MCAKGVWPLRVIFVLAGCLATGCARAVPPLAQAAEVSVPPSALPDDARTELGRADRFQLAEALSAIPVSVRSEFMRFTRERSFSMADSKAAWNATDAIVKGLPFRRLRKVALSESLCVIYYEKGGIAHSYQAVLFRLAKEKATLVWAGYLPESALNPAALLAAIDQHQSDPLLHL
jgi:hypothetical protein